VIYAKSIITPFLLALFISIICVQPISWLEKKRVPKWLALIIVLFGLILLFSGFAFLIGGTISSFSSNVSKYESTLTKISNSFIVYLNEKGLKIPKDQATDFYSTRKDPGIYCSAVNGVLNMMEYLPDLLIIYLFLWNSEVFRLRQKLS